MCTWPLWCRMWKSWYLLWTRFRWSMVKCLPFPVWLCLDIEKFDLDGKLCQSTGTLQLELWSWEKLVDLFLIRKSFYKIKPTRSMPQRTKLLTVFVCLFVCMCDGSDPVKNWTSHRRELRLQTHLSRSCSWRRCGLPRHEVIYFVMVTPHELVQKTILWLVWIIKAFLLSTIDKGTWKRVVLIFHTLFQKLYIFFFGFWVIIFSKKIEYKTTCD